MLSANITICDAVSQFNGGACKQKVSLHSWKPSPPLLNFQNFRKKWGFKFSNKKKGLVKQVEREGIKKRRGITNFHTN